jgi:hypothetical protein
MYIIGVGRGANLPIESKVTSSNVCIIIKNIITGDNKVFL